MKILWFTWKDGKHPDAGGAEAVNEEWATRLVADGHEVLFVVGGFRGGPTRETSPHGFRIVRLGNRYSVYPRAWRYYRSNLRTWPDLVIDEVNTLPFFASKFVDQPSVLLCYMLCRRIWFFQMWFPLNVLGYFLEPLYLRLLRANRVITISESTRNDLMRVGFAAAHISVVPVGIEMTPVEAVVMTAKFSEPTVLSLGAIRPMKRVHEQVEAFEIAKRSMPELRLVVAGGAVGRYGVRLLDRLRTSPFAADIEYRGRVGTAEKIELMRRSHLLLVTSVKEGWCLVVSEAGSQGTPAVTYDADGLRDSVEDGVTGLATGNTPAELADSILRALRGDYPTMAEAARRKAAGLTFDAAYARFASCLRSVVQPNGARVRP